MNQEILKEVLLSQEKYSPDVYAGYRKEVERVLQEEKNRDRSEKKIWVITYWCLFSFVILFLLMTVLVYNFSNTGLWLSLFACTILLFCTQLFGMRFCRQLKLQVIKENKQIQILIVEIMKKHPKTKQKEERR